MPAPLAYTVYLLAALIMYIVGLFSRSSVMKLGKWIGNMMYIIPVFGGLCRKNIRAAFPEKTEDEVKEIARKSLQNLALTALEFFWIRRHRDKFEDLIDLTELHEVALQGQAMMKEGKGTILITPHLGNWEFGGKILALTYKYKMATVVRSSRNPYLDKLISGTRSHSGDVEIIYSKGGAIAMKKALDSGKALGILIDQNVKLRHGGIFVNLFGLPVPVSRAPATLGRHKNRFIAVGVCFRQEDGSFRAYLRRLPKEPCEYESDEELTQAITTLSEEYIRMAPEQYLWMYKRFQHIPEGVPEEVVRRFPDYAKKVKRSFYTRCPARNKK